MKKFLNFVDRNSSEIYTVTVMVIALLILGSI